MRLEESTLVDTLAVEYRGGVPEAGISSLEVTLLKYYYAT